MNDGILKRLEDTQNDMVSLLQRLVQIPTVNLPGENFRECSDLLADTLEGLGLQTEIITVPEEEVRTYLPDYVDYPRYNVLGRWDVGAAKTVHFNAHYDVVPVSGKWKHSPFSGTMDDGLLYGRGSADMKGCIAALCHALSAYRALDLAPAFNIEVSFVCDEEIGGHLGAGYLARHQLTQADYAVVCEGGSDKKAGLGHNGVIWLEVALNGKAAHASRPQNGVNAFEHMARLVKGLQGYKDILNQRTFNLPDGPEMHPTLNLGGTFGQGAGGKTNIVPNHAWFTIDRRVLPNENINEAENDLREQIEIIGKRIPDFNASVKCVSSAASYCNTPNHPLPQALMKAVETVYGEEAQPYLTPGFTDARYFGCDLGIPAAGYGVGGANFHGIDEYVALDDLLKTSQVYATLMTDTSL